MRFAIIAALTLSVLTAAPVHAQPSAVDTALAQAVADDDLAGGVAVVRHGPDLRRYAAGFSDVDTGTGFAPDTHVRVASITKTFVAATVLQLVGEGSVDLDAPIERYLPGRIRGDGIDASAITVRQLLRHQSGLPEYFDEVTEVPTEPVTGERLLDMALTRPAQFAPGTEMKYTNTNYIIAGLLVEKVTGVPAAVAVTARIIVPLGLFDTYFPAPGDRRLRTPFAHGYELVDGVRTDVTEFNATAAGTAGGLVSTNEDVTTFLTALLDGRVVPAGLLEQMQQTVPMPDGDGVLDYGLGLGRVSLPCGVTAWGHGGDLPGYHSFMAKTVDGPAISMTLTQEPHASSPIEDPRGAVLDALFCRA
ncbi:D-alanyl-D-alanine carboxypeptidase [Mycolicibacterium rutilum]|uniref:D-alanyl-D-alanine carboxypeptidase n=1 Tax=Mycolicibacterium rutilum TaxID=370526 RepID=A0A1H6K069_MYCRU|nr:serine hydrolase domain-containing protein [Mycolicibacterium rutilum]SEH64974.1 D-alanyl-D-alanine carboxypeptidase [Mycolicibacterium rutilum]